MTDADLQDWIDVLTEKTADHHVVAHVGLSRPRPGLAVVTLARPEKNNALGFDSWRRLGDVFGLLRERGDLRVVVVRGSGGVFGAGADIAEFSDKRTNPASALTYNEAISRALAAVRELPVPVVAMVRGLAVGGGCELAAACDLRVSSDNARFGIPIGRLGVTLGYVEAKGIARLIGSGNLKWLLFEGELVDAAAARSMGLVEICVVDDDLERRTAALLLTIVASAPVTIRAAKLIADMCDRQLTAADTEQLVRATVEAYGGTDLKEGVEAFLERRRPVFTKPEGES